MQSTAARTNSHRLFSAIDLGLGTISLLLFVVPLIIFVYTGTFTRFIADEYDTLEALKTYGFWGAQSWWYINWSGRFSFTFLVTFIELFDASLFPWITGLVMAGWIAATTYVVYEIFQILHIRRPFWMALAASSMVVYFSVIMITNIHQVLYWVTGITTYVVPLIFLAYLAGFVLRWLRQKSQTRPGWPVLIWFFLLSFIAGGFSETSLVLQVVVFAALLAGGFLWLPKQTRSILLPFFAAGLLGSLLSLAAVGLAPGNSVRVSHTTEKKGLIWALGASFGSVQYYILGSALRKTFFTVICLAGPAILAFLFLDFETDHRPQISIKWSISAFLLTAFGALLLSYAIFFPANYMLSDGPPERSIVVAQFPIGFIILFWGMLAGWSARQWIDQKLPAQLAYLITRAILVVILAGLGSLTVNRCQGYIDLALQAQEYAKEWDIRDQTIRTAAASGQSEVIVKQIWRQGELGDLSEYFDSAINLAAEKYYGIEKIIAQK